MTTMQDPQRRTVERPIDTILREDGRVERICAHGVGHPLGHVTEWQDWMGIHGCDGCCCRASFWMGPEHLE